MDVLKPASKPAAQSSHATGHIDAYESNNEGFFFKIIFYFFALSVRKMNGLVK